eukprot:m.270408 g.270408  ORF g.270408 m.270408 type:complete len:372 (-) comp16263_c6_seq2:109-1224(-)
MPSFPCPVCGKTFPNTFQSSRCRMSEECLAQAVEEKEVSSANRPPYEFDFENAKPGNIMSPSAWEKDGIDGAHHAMGGLGSLGVFLFNLKNDAGVIVVKQASASSVSEFFCSLLYKKLGILTPQMRVLPKHEFLKMIEQCGDVQFTSPGAGDHLQSRGKQRGAVGMEYARGVTLKHPSVVHMLKTDLSSSLLKQLGSIIAADMLVNNFDRTPAIWSHEGNANNILIEQTKSGSIIVKAIDQACTPINDTSELAENAAEYVTRVRSALKEAVVKDTNGVGITKVKKFIQTWANGHDIGHEGACQIFEGMIDCGIKIASMESFASIYEETEKQFQADQVWRQTGLGSINLHFLEKVFNVFVEEMQVYLQPSKV